MIRGRCPICRRSFEVPTLADLPTFPFCSERCRLIDLGAWAAESYRVSVSENAAPSDDAPPDDSSGRS
jgi:endogenous inhibitor of DNA gyrase (YacG/DUF329 family)